MVLSRLGISDELLGISDALLDLLGISDRSFASRDE